MTEPDPDCKDASVWWEWCQYVALSMRGDYPYIDEEDLLHDTTQNIMWQINDKATVKELARISGVEPECFP